MHAALLMGVLFIVTGRHCWASGVGLPTGGTTASGLVAVEGIDAAGERDKSGSVSCAPLSRSKQTWLRAC